MRRWILPVLALNLLSVVASATPSSTIRCEHIFSPYPYERERRSEPAPKMSDDFAFLTELQRVSTLGALDTRFIDKWDTRVYYSATAKPRRDGTLPLVNEEARGTYIFIHGSGTARATARNFSKKMNDLTNMGYFTAGVDLPKHGHGPVSEAYENPDFFFSWLHKIVTELRVPGKPLYLSGHSFGPHVIAEYVRRYPNTVDGIELLSPVVFDEVTTRWYYEKTMKMKFDNVAPNELGGLWGDKMMASFRWNSGRAEDDISRLNPNMKIRIVTGDREEFVPAPTGGPKGLPIEKNSYELCKAMAKFMSGASCLTLAGLGHQVLEHRDAEGFDTVIKEALALDNKTPADIRAMKYENGMRPLSSREKIAQKYARDRLFANWLLEKLESETRVRRLISAQSDHGSTTLLAEYDLLLERRQAAIFENIKATKEWAPQFYAANEKIIATLAKPKDETKSTLLGRYFEFLGNVSPELRNQHASFQR